MNINNEEEQSQDSEEQTLDSEEYLNSPLNNNFNMLEHNRIIFEAINTIISDAAANAAEEQALATAIDQSLQMQAAYKETISDEGIKQLKETTYNKNTHLNDKCSITLEDLKEWDGPVTELPCNHVFLPDAIYEWLKEKPVCPICRYKMDSVEIKVKQQDPQEEDLQEPQEPPSPPPQTLQNYPTSSTILNTLLYLNQHGDDEIFQSRNTFLRNINSLNHQN